MSLLSTIRTSSNHIPKWALWVGALIIIVGAVIGIHKITAPSNGANVSLTTNLSHVKVAAVSDISISTNSTPIVGTVTSLNQSTILSQIPGEIVSLPHVLGDKVASGTIIAEFENSSQQAGVLQAQGAYEAAQTGLTIAQGTSATGSKIGVAQATQNVTNAQNAFSNALQGMYVALDDAVHAKADQLFSNPKTPLVRLTITVPNSRLVILLQQERLKLDTAFATIISQKSNVSSSTLDKRSATMITTANSVIQFLGNLATAVNETRSSQGASATVLAGYTASLGAARMEVNSALSGLIATKSAYDNALAGMQAAKNVATSGTPDTIALAKARLKQASGAVDAAHAALEKTIIRSPINGTIVSMPITLGDYVPMFSPVAIVSNPNALYIKTFVTSNTASTLSIGNRAVVNGSYDGSVTFVAPSLDPLTHKREVKIALTGSQGTLTDGETVLVAFTRTPIAGANAVLTVPLSAIRVTPVGPEVFTVSTTSALVAHPVIIKNIEGSFVSLKTGITPATQIVLDARGLSIGQKVVVDNK